MVNKVETMSDLKWLMVSVYLRTNKFRDFVQNYIINVKSLR